MRPHPPPHHGKCHKKFPFFNPPLARMPIYIVIRLERCWIYALWASEQKEEWTEWVIPLTVMNTRAPAC